MQSEQIKKQNDKIKLLNLTVMGLQKAISNMESIAANFRNRVEEREFDMWKINKMMNTMKVQFEMLTNPEEHLQLQEERPEKTMKKIPISRNKGNFVDSESSTEE